METMEELNEDFNEKKPKKAKFIKGGIICTVVIIAFLLVYFCVFNKPQHVFDEAIERLFKIETKEYNSLKLNSNMKVAVETDDEDTKSIFEEIEKCNLKIGAQIDGKENKQIANLGLEYDNKPVIDSQIYYNNGEVYAYFDGIFEKYIKVDLTEEQKEDINTIFDVFESQKERNTNKKRAMKILSNELKSQIKKEGSFDKKSDILNIGNKENKVTKYTLILSQQEVNNIICNTCRNLSENDKFLKCFEKYETAQDELKKFAETIEDELTNDEMKLRISIYTKGLLKNVVGVDFELSSSENDVAKISIAKEGKNTYSYSISGEQYGANVEIANGNVQLEEKNSKNNKEGNISISIKISELVAEVKANLTVDYSVEYNNGIDEIDESNNIKIEELTENDFESMLEKLKQRPLIGDLISALNSLQNNSENNIIDESDFEENYDELNYDEIYDGSDDEDLEFDDDFLLNYDF